MEKEEGEGPPRWVVLGCVRKEGEEAMESSIPSPCSLLQYLPDFLQEMDCDLEVQVK